MIIQQIHNLGYAWREPNDSCSDHPAPRIVCSQTIYLFFHTYILGLCSYIPICFWLIDLFFVCVNLFARDYGDFGICFILISCGILVPSFFWSFFRVICIGHFWGDFNFNLVILRTSTSTSTWYFFWNSTLSLLGSFSRIILEGYFWDILVTRLEALAKFCWTTEALLDFAPPWDIILSLRRRRCTNCFIPST